MEPISKEKIKFKISLFVFFILAIQVCGFSLSHAHEIRPIIATIEFKTVDEVALNITLNLEAAIAGIGAEHEDTSDSPAATEYDQLRLLSSTALQEKFKLFTFEFLNRISLLADKKPIPLTILNAKIPEIGDTALPRISELYLKGSSPTDIAGIYWKLDSRLGNSVIRLRDSVTTKIQGAEFVLAGNTSVALSVEGLQPQTWTSVFMKYLEIGFTHIVPKGLDHILFVVGLFLLSTHLKALLWQITAFTLAHTLTLALGVQGIVQLSPTIVEPLIAASIIYVAIENIMTQRLHRWRLIIVFCFGLLHGLGFAGILQEIGSAQDQLLLSLLSFNLGVELGQLSVIAACFLIIGWAMHKNWYHKIIVIPSSISIAIIAGIWFFERIN